MPDTKSNPSDEIAAALKEFGNAITVEIGGMKQTLSESRERSIEEGKKLLAAIEALGNSGTEATLKERYLAAHKNKTAPNKGADETIDAFIERMRERTTRATVRVPGAGDVSTAKRARPGAAGIDLDGCLPIRMMRAHALAHVKGSKGKIDDVIEAASAAWGSSDEAVGELEAMRDLSRRMNGTVADREAITRALGTGVAGSGGLFVDSDVQGPMLKMLRDDSVMDRMGVRSLPIRNGHTVIFQKSGAQVGARQEGTGVNASKLSEGKFEITRRLYQGITYANAELLAESSWAVDADMRDDLISQLAALRDIHMIEGTGASNMMHGLDFWVQQPTVSHVFNRSLDGAVATAKTVRKDIINALKILANAKIKTERGENGSRFGLIFASETKYGLLAATQGTDEHNPFEAELNAGTLMGIPYAASTSLRTDLAGAGNGTGTNNKSCVYLGDFANLVAAEDQAIDFKVSDSAAFKDENGALQSAFINNQVVMVANMKTELYDKRGGLSFVKIESVDWAHAFTA